MQKKYYAIEWLTYGMINGMRCARWFWFRSARERDEWVLNGHPYRGKGFRESISSRDPELNSLQYRERKNSEIGLHIQDIRDDQRDALG